MFCVPRAGSSRNDKPCEITIKSTADLKSGHFDLRGPQNWNANCTVRFEGKEPEIVHISLFNYVLKWVSRCDVRLRKTSTRVVELYLARLPHAKHNRKRNGVFARNRYFRLLAELSPVLHPLIRPNAKYYTGTSPLHMLIRWRWFYFGTITSIVKLVFKRGGTMNYFPG